MSIFTSKIIYLSDAALRDFMRCDESKYCGDIMRIAVIGAGAMGGLFGARLALGGQEVSLIDASEPTIQAIKRQGLILKSHGGSNTVMLPVGRADDFQNPFDLLIIFTKGFH
ncbi:ketopantoate reductase family protein, partial [Pseudomonas sp. NBRC 111126]